MAEERKKRVRLALLALALASCAWFFVTWERDAQKSFRLPVRIVNVPAGLSVASRVPPAVDLGLVGPRILLLNLNMEGKEIVLDLAAAGEGDVAFLNIEKMVSIRPELKIMRIAPSRIDLRLVSGGAREGKAR